MRIECGTSGHHRYEIAGIEVVTDSAWEEFEPFRTSLSRAPGTEPRPSVAYGALETRRARGVLAGLEREVTAIWQANSVELRCAGSRVALAFDEEETVARGSTAGELDRELIVGPGLLLALTAAGRLTLHAGAARVGSRTLLFAGDSGAGKSTLARAFGAEATADDLVAIDTESWRHWARLPQRKWLAEQQVDLAQTSGEVIWLVLQGDRETDSPAIEPLAPAAILKSWLAHTAGSRLYSRDWQADWLAHCAEAARNVPGFRLLVPWRHPDPDANAQRTANFLRRRFAELP